MGTEILYLRDKKAHEVGEKELGLGLLQTKPRLLALAG